MSKFDLTKNSTTLVTDKWFKLKLVSRKDPTNIDYAYVSGLHAIQVKHDYQPHLRDYILTVKPIEYSRIVRKVS